MQFFDGVVIQHVFAHPARHPYGFVEQAANRAIGRFSPGAAATDDAIDISHGHVEPTEIAAAHGIRRFDEPIGIGLGQPLIILQQLYKAADIGKGVL